MHTRAAAVVAGAGADAGLRIPIVWDCRVSERQREREGQDSGRIPHAHTACRLMNATTQLKKRAAPFALEWKMLLARTLTTLLRVKGVL